MERTLPRTPRSARRCVSWTLALLSTAALAGGPAVLSAQADDLHDKKNHAHESTKAALADLEDSSKALSAAYSRLKAAKTQLVSAQRQLAVTEGQLTAARVLDAQMQTKLIRAEAALEKAKTDLATGVANVKAQRSAIGRLIAANYQQGDPRIIGLSMVLTATDPVDLANQLGIVDSVMDQETGMYERLKAAESMLRVQTDKVESARGQVAEQRQAAAVNLARRNVLEKRAVVVQDQVSALVTQRHGAAAFAQKLRARDAARLRASKKVEARIRRLILARAAKNKHGGYQGRSNGFLYRPVPGNVTSPFGWRRHPIYGYWGLHDGVDFHAPCGTPERAGAAGTIISEYYSDVWGNRLYLDVGRVNGKAMTLIYNHISSYREHTGAHVSRGEVLAYAGTTGWSTGCHLHFTVMLNGTAVDPMKFL